MKAAEKKKPVKAEKPARIVRGRTVEKTVKVNLTEFELLDRGQKLAQAISEQRAAESDLASFKAQIKARLESAQADIGKFQSCIKEKAEWRPMNCFEQFDFDAKTVSVIRPDTMAAIEVREMTERELQCNLPGVNPDNDTYTIQCGESVLKFDSLDHFMKASNTALKLSESSATLRRMLGAQYETKIAPVMAEIQKPVTLGKKSSVLSSLTDLIAQAPQDGPRILCLCAAASELLNGKEHES